VGGTSLMNKYIKFFLSFSMIVLLGYIVYVLFMYTKNNFSSVLFYFYLTLGILINGGGLVALVINLFREKTILNQTVADNQKILNKNSLLYTFRVYLSSFLGLLYSIPNWLSIIMKSFIDSIKNKNNSNIKSTRSDLHALSLIVFDVWYSIYAFMSIFILLLLDNDYTNISIQIIFIAIILRHLNYIIEVDTLPVRLRRTLVNPYIHYMVILIFDFLALLVSTVYFLHNTIFIDYNTYYNALVKLFGYKDLLKHIKDLNYSFNDYLITIAGFMFLMSLAKMLFSFKKFKKIDEDYTWKAQRLAIMGKYNKALETINNVKGFTEVDYMIKIAILLGINNLKDAISLAKDYNKNFHKIKRSRIDDVFRTLIDASMSLEMEDNVQSEIIKYGLDNNIDDCILADLAIPVILSLGDLEKNTLIDIIITKKNEYRVTYTYLMLAIENNQNKGVPFTSQKGNILVFIKENKNIDNQIEYIMLTNLELTIMSEDKYYSTNVFNKIKKEYFLILKQFKIHKYSLLTLTIVSFKITSVFDLKSIDTNYKEQTLLLLKDILKYIEQSDIENNFYAKKLRHLIITIDPN